MKHESLKNQLEALSSKIDALEAGAADEHQKSIAQAMQMVVTVQLHMAEKMQHIVKGMDITLEQIFELQNKAGLKEISAK